MKSESDRVEEGSDWYLREQLDVDVRLIRYRYRTIQRHLLGPSGLELGPAEGQMTRFLVDDFDDLTVVEGSSALLARVDDRPNLRKVHSLFEDFEPDRRYNTVILEHILEHVAEPVDLVRRASGWLAPGGRMIVGVPNGNSLHRLAATKMGLLADPCELNERDQALGHRRVYTWSTLRSDLEATGMTVTHTDGVFIKPLSNGQMQETWSEEMFEGFFELGRDLPELAAEIVMIAKQPPAP